MTEVDPEKVALNLRVQIERERLRLWRMVCIMLWPLVIGACVMAVGWTFEKIAGAVRGPNPSDYQPLVEPLNKIIEEMARAAKNR